MVSVVFGTDLAGVPGEAIDVAWENEAELVADDPSSVRIEPQIAIKKTFDDATVREDGGLELEWDWTITATEVGVTTFTLLIRPLIFVDGQLSPDAAVRNEPIEIPVEIHPAEEAFDEAVASSKEIVVDGPTSMTDGSERPVTVRLHRTWDPDAGVVAALDLRSGTDSTRITVDSAMALDGDGWLSQTWTVMPTETGPLTLDVAVHLSAEAGERDPLTFDEVVEQHSIDVQPTAWDRLREPLLYLTSIATLAGAVLGSWAYVRNHRRQAVEVVETDEDPDDPTARPDEADSAVPARGELSALLLLAAVAWCTATAGGSGTSDLLIATVLVAGARVLAPRVSTARGAPVVVALVALLCWMVAVGGADAG